MEQDSLKPCDFLELTVSNKKKGVSNSGNSFVRIWNDMWGDLSSGAVSKTPAMNTEVNNDYIRFELSVPLMEIEDVKVLYLEAYDELSFVGRAQRKKKKKYKVKEFEFDSFARMYQLDRPVDIEKMEKKFESGVLMITIPWKK